MSADSLQTRVREVLRNIVAEEELEGVVDAEITKARENLRTSASRVASDFIQAKMKAWAEAWEGTEEANKVVNELGDAMIESIKTRYLDPDYGNYNAERVNNKIEESVLKEIQNLVDQRLYQWRETSEMQDVANKVVENLIPRASALALEQLAIRALNERLVVVSQNLGVNMVECGSYTNGGYCKGQTAPGQYCPQCGTQKRG